MATLWGDNIVHSGHGAALPTSYVSDLLMSDIPRCWNESLICANFDNQEVR